MDAEVRYKNFVLNKFLEQMRGYRIYYSESQGSYWWVNPKTNSWAFEVEKTGILWWYFSWGNKFKELMGMESSDFKDLIETYVKITLSLGLKNFNSNLFVNGNPPLMDDFEEHIIDFINGRPRPGNPNISTKLIESWIKTLYHIDDPQYGDLEELIIKSKEEKEVKDYCKLLESSDHLNSLVVDIIEENN